MMSDAPERIYLQDGGDYAAAKDAPGCEVTWCDHPVEDGDTEYVRADRIAALEAEVARLLDENSALAAWQCVFTDGRKGLVCDEYGGQYCAMERRAEKAEAEVARLRGAYAEAAAMAKRRAEIYDAENNDNEDRAHCLMWGLVLDLEARAALGDAKP